MWYYLDNEINSINDMPEGVIGFVYKLTFTDNTKYIGKKSLYSTRIIKSLKNGKSRENTVEHLYRNTGKGFRQKFDVIKKESDWKTYQGSAVECKNKTVARKEIIQYAFSNQELTYLEAKMLFKYDVLENSNYINDNILGKFYRGKLYGENINTTTGNKEKVP